MIRVPVIIALSLVFASASAQKLEVGLAGGLSVNSAPSSLHGSYSTSISPAGRISGAYLLTTHWQVGVSVSAQKWQNSSDYLTSTIKNVWANPAWDISLFGNYLLPIKRTMLYGGLSAGPTLTSSSGESTEKKMISPQSSTGFHIGLQIGGTKYLSKRFGINAELAPKLAMMKMEESDAVGDNTYSILYFPLTVGVRCRL